VRTPSTLVLLAVLLTGCAVAYPTLDEIAREQKTRMKHLRVGMTRQDVHDRMGRGRLSYRVHLLDSETIRRPLNTERRRDDDGNRYTIYWYHARPGYLTPEPSTPILLKNGTVEAWGDTALRRYREGLSGLSRDDGGETTARSEEEPE